MTILHVICKECGVSKPWTAYYRKASGGIKCRTCKECYSRLSVKKVQASYSDPDYVARKREIYRRYANKRYASDPEFREKKIKIETERYGKCARTREATFAKTITRRAAKKQRTIVDDGLTMFVLREAHALTKLREKMIGGKWDVDHIEPLQGTSVSGLHTAFNFAVIPRTLNRGLQNTPKEVGCFGCVLTPRKCEEISPNAYL